MFTLDDSNGHPVFEGQNATWRVSPRGPTGTIAGRPYLRTKANSKAVGARGDVIYGNLRHYGFVVDTDNMAVERSDHYAFNAGLVTFRLIVYVGGRVLDGNAFCVLDDVAGVSSSDSSST
jgi:HK97 family phage major capsid protein